MKDEIFPPIEKKSGVIFTDEIVRYTHRAYLSDSILDIHSYAHFVNMFETAQDGDTIHLYLANLGGRCDSCVYIANAMKMCKGTVNVIVAGRCCSAGATLALCGHGLQMRPNTYLMFHNYSSVDGGKGQELKQSVEETRRWIHGYFRMFHSPFLTDEEIKNVEKDQDVYIHWDDRGLIKRLKRHFPFCSVVKASKRAKK